MNKQIYVKINSPSLGDTICATPSLRKLAKAYNRPLIIATAYPELFKNNKYVQKVYSFEEMDIILSETNDYELFNTFVNFENKRHNVIDIRQFHAIDLGFTLLPSEMECEYTPDIYIPIKNLPTNYICIHPSNTWASRTYSQENWQKIINLCKENSIPVVIVGKNSEETGGTYINKDVQKLILNDGIDLSNKLSLSQTYHVINMSKMFITMDSGLLHLAGTTDTHIVQLGSSINNKLRAPYRKNSQEYKYKCISGTCDLFCASDLKYAVKEWNTIKQVPLLLNCLENKNTFECHPQPTVVYDYIKENCTFVDKNKKICTFNPQPKIEILGDQKFDYKITFIDNNTGVVHFESDISTNMWTSCNIRYFVNWKIYIHNKNLNTTEHILFNPTGKNVYIYNESPSLGDTISWMPAIDAFQKRYSCKLDYFTIKKDLFEKQYPNINFYNYDVKNNGSYYVGYSVGCFEPKDKHLTFFNWREIPLQDVANKQLGLKNINSKTRLVYNKIPRIISEKYVCIATQSTSQSRYWNNNSGWIKLVNYLKSKGYKVICVDQHNVYGIDNHWNTIPNNVDQYVGKKSLNDIMSIIDDCEFFIGLSSGLSWLTWALNKKIISISGSVADYYEFNTPYRIQNKKVCNSCFNNPKYNFDPSNWLWCPENKNFECTKEISFETVRDAVDKCMSDLK